MIIRLAIVALSLAGLWESFYFTFAYYGRVKRARWVPAILCAREGSSCVTVVQTPYARVFGVPNSLLGIMYYALLVFWATGGRAYSFGFRVRMTEYSLTLTGLLIAASAVTVALGIYLIYALLKELHTHCPLCYTAHAINLTILILLIVSAGTR
jgi:uncharacterized membrane protein